MPQIWLTYGEFAAFMKCDPAQARQASIAAGLDRRKSRDGQTRVKLSEPLTDAFFDLVMRQFLERNMTTSAAQLRAVRGLMAKPPTRTTRLAG